MEDAQEAPAVVGCLGSMQRKFQHYVDKTTVWTKTRWLALVVCLLLYVARVYLIQGFYIVSYGLGIYLLNLLIGFLSPAVDPEVEEVLPTKEAAEFRPFTRKLPEFKFWFGAIRAVVVATTLTFFTFFDLPVFWPILLAYFIVLVVLTMKD
ncbi:RER1B, partial [Symbiodinium pilosum]